MSAGYVNGGERVTRKRHLCAYCLTQLPPGTRAHWWVWSDCGEATTYYGHDQCVEMFATVNRFGQDTEMMDPGEFRDVCVEEWPGREFPWTTEESTEVKGTP